ncbi:hypothetical protein [Methylobacterium iners]|uniref:hypothetical protein n=1 Tax=Methylobacterium iners TaxID=418707 RepID=UPI001EE29226|nr:hypothetical protein [Methylobacterium iners]
MKRRQSARPVVVEIKRTRTPVSSSINNARPSHTSNVLWRGTALVEAPAVVTCEPNKPYALDAKASASTPLPTRRVLPSLIPMYVPSSPQQDEQQEERNTPRTRRTMTAKKVQSVTALSDRPVAAVGRMKTLDQDDQETQVEVVSPPLDLSREQGPLKIISAMREVRRGREQPIQKLRRGEFWKRRLPSVCW